MKFKVGDKLVLKDDLGENNMKGRNLYAEEMAYLKGATVSINGINFCHTYSVDESEYGILEEMIDLPKTKELGDVSNER